MTISDAHTFIEFVINKKQVGHISHEEVDNALDHAQMLHFMELVGNPRGYQPGRPIPPIAYGITGRIHSDLMPFKKTIDYNDNPYNPTTNANGSGQKGVIVLPTDFLILTSCRSTEYDNTLARNRYHPVKILNENQLSQRLESQILAPTDFDPAGLMGAGISSIVNTNIQLESFQMQTGTGNEPTTFKTGVAYTVSLTNVGAYPANIVMDYGGTEIYNNASTPQTVSFGFVADADDQDINWNIVQSAVTCNVVITQDTVTHDITGRYSIKLFPENGQAGTYTYLRRPAKPDFSYSLNGRIVTQDVNASQDLEWNDMATNTIILRALGVLGVNLSDSASIQYSELLKSQSV